MRLAHLRNCTATAHNALPGVWEVAGLSHPNQMIVEVQVAVPYPEQVREAEVLEVLPFGRKTLKVESGGMIVQGRANTHCVSQRQRGVQR